MGFSKLHFSYKWVKNFYDAVIIISLIISVCIFFYVDIEQSMLQRNDENADHHISREEVIAQLADPLLVLSANRRHSRGANSFILFDTFA